MFESFYCQYFDVLIMFILKAATGSNFPDYDITRYLQIKKRRTLFSSNQNNYRCTDWKSSSSLSNCVWWIRYKKYQTLNKSIGLYACMCMKHGVIGLASRKKEMMALNDQLYLLCWTRRGLRKVSLKPTLHYLVSS